jgi:hypothetical protein
MRSPKMCPTSSMLPLPPIVEHEKPVGRSGLEEGTTQNTRSDVRRRRMDLVQARAAGSWILAPDPELTLTATSADSLSYGLFTPNADCGAPLPSAPGQPPLDIPRA